VASLPPAAQYPLRSKPRLQSPRHYYSSDKNHLYIPGQAILAGLIILALICGAVCFGLDLFRRANKKSKEKKV